MLDQNTFIETIQGVAEIIRTAPKPLGRDEILSYFKDMELNEVQENMVLEYLLKPHDEEEADEQTDAQNGEVEADVQTAEQNDKDEDDISELDTEVDESRLIPQSPVFQMYLQEIEELPVYSSDAVNDMYKKLLAGDDSVISIISNIWLKTVLDMAKKLAVTSEGFEDVVQEGNMALFMCLTELCGCEAGIDVEKELLDAIENAMESCIREQTGCDEGENTIVGKVSLVNRAIEHLKVQKNDEPTVEELADYTSVPKEELISVLELIKKADIQKNQD